MDSDSWTRVSTYSRRRQSRSDVYHGEGYEGEEELNPEYLCPFCAEDFDMVGLCCHIDEVHAVEAKNGVPTSPLSLSSCLWKVLIGFISWLFLRLRRGGSNSPFYILRRELRDGNLQSLFGGSSLLGSSSHTEPDPMLTSFIYNPPMIDKSSTVQPLSSVEDGSLAEHTVENLADRLGHKHAMFVLLCRLGHKHSRQWEIFLSLTSSLETR
ncbi:hypothetical protein DH2020_004427 [Rehmannia glutinosa]|uniref:Uncharacterized protein n=1 Tax=Rehmannia glutinosa TaxID=99300 RepID=A0ABR0XPC4_REHGL